jgi:hypothetical protein
MRLKRRRRAGVLRTLRVVTSLTALAAKCGCKIPDKEAYIDYTAAVELTPPTLVVQTQGEQRGAEKGSATPNLAVWGWSKAHSTRGSSSYSALSSSTASALVLPFVR